MGKVSRSVFSFLNNFFISRLELGRALFIYLYELVKQFISASESPTIPLFELSNSQAGQESFVIHVLRSKHSGTYLEVGAGHPIVGSNTLVLEQQFNWKGLSIDISSEFRYLWHSIRKNPLLVKDALALQPQDIFTVFQSHIDYLQIDVNDPKNCRLILQRLINFGLTFGVLTIEHDTYVNRNNVIENQQIRKLLAKNGYCIIAEDVSHRWRAFEDWWVQDELKSRALPFVSKRREGKSLFSTRSRWIVLIKKKLNAL
jgi:hypothetical protein